MNAPLRRVGMVMMILFALLFANLNWVQVYKADEYRTDDTNNRVRVQQQEYERERGQIIVDGKAVALSAETNDTLRFLRQYPPNPQLYAHVAGYRPVDLGATGIELLENEFLAGHRAGTRRGPPAGDVHRQGVPRRKHRAQHPPPGAGDGVPAVAEQLHQRDEGRRRRPGSGHWGCARAGLDAELRPQPAGQPRPRQGGRRVRQARRRPQRSR